jgi:hypothetical protein
MCGPVEQLEFELSSVDASEAAVLASITAVSASIDDMGVGGTGGSLLLFFMGPTGNLSAIPFS